MVTTIYPRRSVGQVLGDWALNVLEFCAVSLALAVMRWEGKETKLE